MDATPGSLKKEENFGSMLQSSCPLPTVATDKTEMPARSNEGLVVAIVEVAGGEPVPSVLPMTIENMCKQPDERR